MKKICIYNDIFHNTTTTNNNKLKINNKDS